MTPEQKHGNRIEQSLKPTEPTIWALRRNTSNQNRAAAQTAASAPEGTLYEHLFGYDPIRLRGPVAAPARPEEVQKGSAENPKLNILNPATNFLVKELTSDDGANA